jgi:hypothetical protein
LTCAARRSAVRPASAVLPVDLVRAGADLSALASVMLPGPASGCGRGGICAGAAGP